MLGVSGEDATRAAGVRYFANGGFTDGSKEKLDNLIDFSKAYGKYALRSNGIRTTGDALSMLWTVANNSMSGDASLALAATSLAADVAPLLLNKYLGSDSPVTIALTEAAKNYNGGTVLSSWQDGAEGYRAHAVRNPGERISEYTCTRRQRRKLSAVCICSEHHNHW